MISTLRTKAASVAVFSGARYNAPGRVNLQIEARGATVAVTLTPEEAAMLAGEIERAAWRAQRDAAALLSAA